MRWYDRSGNWVGTDRERLIQAQKEVEIVRKQKEDAERKAARLAVKLRELGVEPD